jgi:GNAT superfamily N-acetyltransferase
MVTPSSATPVIRDANPRDFLPITTMLTAALAGSPMACWLSPEGGSRRLTLLAYVGDLAQRAIASGIGRVAEHGGEIVGAALWSLHGRTDQFAREAFAGEGAERSLTGANQRQRLLNRFADGRRPRGVACQQLLCLGVRPDRQGQAIGSYLLIGHHAFLHVTRTPAYLVAPDDRLSTWFERYGYSGIGPPQLSADGLPMKAMWRPPGPADLLP